MALFNESLVQEITALVGRRYNELGTALGAQPVEGVSSQAGEATPLQRDLRLLIAVANGEHMRTNAMVRRVELALNRLMDLLLGNVLQSRAILPDSFWQTDIGVVVSRARWWISSDDLITISNAAALAFGENTQASRMRIARAMDNGLLDWVPDPSVSNPHHNRRVLRAQVERMRDLSRLPDSE
ncbi:MAG: hypothetical protein ABI670_07375 [Chloroflexota bacterium]